MIQHAGARQFFLLIKGDKNYNQYKGPDSITLYNN